MSLYVNGLEIKAEELGVHLTSVWSPFFVVEKCQRCGEARSLFSDSTCAEVDSFRRGEQ